MFDITLIIHCDAHFSNKRDVHSELRQGADFIKRYRHIDKTGSGADDVARTVLPGSSRKVNSTFTICANNICETNPVTKLFAFFGSLDQGIPTSTPQSRSALSDTY